MLTHSPIIAIRSSEDLLTMDIAPALEKEKQHDVEQVLCHVDFDKLLAAAHALRKLVRSTGVISETRNGQTTDPFQIVSAVLLLEKERKVHCTSSSPVLLRNVDSTVDSVMDECFQILKNETDRYLKYKQEQDQTHKSSNLHQQVEQGCAATTTASPMTVAQHEEENEHEWERLLEIVSSSFDLPVPHDMSAFAIDEEQSPQMVYSGRGSRRDMEDPLVTFAAYWNQDSAKQRAEDNSKNHIEQGIDATPEDMAIDDDVISIVTWSSCEEEEEQDPIDLFPEYWGEESSNK